MLVIMHMMRAMIDHAKPGNTYFLERYTVGHESENRLSTSSVRGVKCIGRKLLRTYVRAWYTPRRKYASLVQVEATNVSAAALLMKLHTLHKISTLRKNGSAAR